MMMMMMMMRRIPLGQTAQRRHSLEERDRMNRINRLIRPLSSSKEIGAGIKGTPALLIIVSACYGYYKAVCVYNFWGSFVSFSKHLLNGDQQCKFLAAC